VQRTVWCLSNPRLTVRVVTEAGTIVEAAPVVRKFIGQPLLNLLKWMRPDRIESWGSELAPAISPQDP